MGQFLTPVADARDNIQVSEDGTVWANYLLTGINVNPYVPSTITAARAQNKALLSALSTIDSTDMLLGGFKAQTPPEEIIQRVIQGVQKMTTEKYPELMELIENLEGEFRRGNLREHRRVYFLSIKLPVGRALEGGGTLRRIGALNPLAGLDWKKIAKLDQAIFDVLPPAFEPRRSHPGHLTWLHDRARLRGLQVPTLPSHPRTDVQTTTFNPHGFGQVIIDKAADGNSTLQQFIDAVDSGTVPTERKGRLGKFLAKYQAAREGQVMAIHSPELRTPQLPDGPGSLQSVLVVHGFPRTPSDVLNTFTYLVDQKIGLDADFALRLNFSQEVLSVEHQRRFRRTLHTEAEANSVDVYDLNDYQLRDHESKAFYASAQNESGARGLEITALFAFADPNHQRLITNVNAVKAKLEGNHFSVGFPVGAQFDLLKQMLPGSVCSDLVTDCKQATTAHQFSACLPIRRTTLGDRVGIPIAINRENALGQVVLWDLLGGTESGGNSMALTGTQGRGKSHFFKLTMEWIKALRRPNWWLDHSPHGEYQVFGSQFRREPTQVVNVAKPDLSLDPFKVFTDNPAMLQEMVVEVLTALLRIEPESPLGKLITDLSSPQIRDRYHICSMRDLMQVLENGTFGGLRGVSQGADQELLLKMQAIAGMHFTRALFDPIGNSGRPEILPAFAPNGDATSVVFRTHGLKLATGNTERISALQRYSQVIYTLIARIATYQFSQVRGTCLLGGDEMSFTAGSSVLNDLIQTPQRMGRKEGNVVLSASQLAAEQDSEHYRLVRRRIILGQDTKPNAIEAFTWADLPPTPNLVTEMVTDTSPLDPNNNRRVLPGREGEGWYSDGAGNAGRIKVLPLLRADSRRLGDTTTSRMIRDTDLVTTASPAVQRSTRPHTANGHQPAVRPRHAG